MNPEAQHFTALDLKSRYWEIIRLNLVKRSVKLRSPRRPLRFLWNSRGIHRSQPYVASLVCALWGARGVAKSLSEAHSNIITWGTSLAGSATARNESCCTRCEWAGMLLMEHQLTHGVEEGELCLGAGGGCIAAEQWGAEGDHHESPLNYWLQVECA